jgi:hypothetical protein
VRCEDDLNADELDYLAVLTDLDEAYDERNCPELDDRTPLDRLRGLLQCGFMLESRSDGMR